MEKKVDVQTEAAKLEQMCQSGQGHDALEEFRHLVATDKTLGTAVFKKMQTDAQQGQGETYMDTDKLVFNSVFNGAGRIYGDN